MKRRIYRYFFNFIEGQEGWLNYMAKEGWRLVKCGQISYDFEPCSPGEYEYAVEFVAGKSYANSKEYKAFLEEMGYRAHYKNINIGHSVGKVRWRPWGEKGGKFSAAPGSYQKELILVEKKKDGKPFALHTDLSDSLFAYSAVQEASFTQAVGFLALTLMLTFFSLVMQHFMLGLGALLCGGLCYVFMIPGIRAIHKIRRLREEGAVREHNFHGNRWILRLVAAIILPIVLLSFVFNWYGLTGNTGRGTNRSGSAFFIYNLYINNDWKALYPYFNGYEEKTVTLAPGDYTFTVKIKTDKGNLALTITGEDGQEYYKETDLQAFVVFPITLTEKETLTIRMDAEKHKGSFDIQWNPN